MKVMEPSLMWCQTFPRGWKRHEFLRKLQRSLEITHSIDDSAFGDLGGAWNGGRHRLTTGFGVMEGEVANFSDIASQI